MGMFSDLHRIEWQGATIEIEVRGVGFSGIQYDLVINDQRVDRIGGSSGTFFLRGVIPETEGQPPKKVKVKIRQHFLSGTTCFLMDGEREIQIPQIF